jgi:hypothetical protein
MRLRLPRLALALLPALCAASLLGAAPAPPERAPKSKLAFLYDKDKDAAEAFKKLLDEEKLPTDLVAVSDLGTADLKPYTLILVGADTGDAGAKAARTVDGAQKPTLALGEGGYSYLGGLGLAIGAPHGWHGQKTDVVAVDPDKSKFWAASKVKLPENNTLTLYKAAGHVAIHMAPPPADAVLLGREAGDATHYVLVQQGPRHVLWGFNGPPGQMTAEGRQLFAHTCRYTETLGAAKK